MKNSQKVIPNTPVKVNKVKTKKVSKTWLAVLSLQGTGEILDMKAVLK